MTSNLDRTKDFIALWSRIDLEAILAMMAPHCIYHNMPWAPLQGHDAIREGLTSFLAGAAAIDWQLLHAAENRDGMVMTERVDRFLIADRWIEMPVMGIFEWQDGLIIHWRDYFDSARFQAEMATIS
ncbi:limonene-1,2-epoxide hydrolase family protein [Sphingobium sp. YR768]|jgi:limonene-1,2-epoxide hydrolase|uniref:limonene-1,2-epoxide hydrolase family protein n=1 Tax=Sphingobium sp. YR768 TaxID=1884365 RepID=UPI0008CD193D|nr:limonene-1,2-epoxide hydrolase family protein [Sphingobium sp. YR768]SER71432.1 limonene-1,2-epoxide hydrolase [Sphingobium sp. YR768]